MSEHPKHQSDRTLDLWAVVESPGTPVAEVLAIVGQQPILPFAQTRPGAVYDFPRRISVGRVFDDPDRMTRREAD
jgi:hypothetical protein